MASNPTSCSSIVTLLASIYISCRFGWIVKEGRKINDRFEKRRSKQITDALEKRFGLIPSSKVTEKAVAETLKVDIGKGNIKEQVASVVRMVLGHYRFCSLGELNAILSAYNLTVEEIKTEFRGKKYDGLVYVPTNDKGGKMSTPIHLSLIHISEPTRLRQLSRMPSSA